MDSDRLIRLIGIGIMAFCIVIVIIYFGLLFLGYGIEVAKSSRERSLRGSS